MNVLLLIVYEIDVVAKLVYAKLSMEVSKEKREGKMILNSPMLSYSLLDGNISDLVV